MDYKKQAEDLVNQHRIILMDSDTDAGEEILCTSLAKKHAEITVNALVMASYDVKEIQQLAKVKKAILDL